VPFNQVPLFPWGSVPVAAVETFYRRRDDTYASSYGYAGFTFANINPIAASPFAGCCVKRTFDYLASASAAIVAQFAADGSGFTVTRAPDFTTPAGSFSSTNLTEGQGGCSEIPPDQTIGSGDADFGSEGLRYYTFADADAASATTRAGNFTNPNFGGRQGAASCEGGIKIVPGTLTLSGTSSLSLPFTRVDAAAAVEAALPDIATAAWGATSPDAYRLVSAGSLSSSGLSFTRNGEAAFFNCSVQRAQWRAAVREDWWAGYIHRLFYREDFYPGDGGAVIEGEEQYLDIAPETEDYTAPLDVTPPTALGTTRVVMLRVERRKP
jgi:hypothetical protein